MREFIVGYLRGMADLIKVKVISIKKVEDDPHAWRWEMKWE